MNVKEQSDSRFYIVLNHICIGLLVVVLVGKIANDRPWFVFGLALFFACTLIVLYVCIDLILDRLGTGISVKNLRESIFYYLFIILNTISMAMDFIQKLPSVERQDSVWLLVFLFFSALFTGMFIYNTLQVLKTNKTTPTQQIEPSMESRPPIVP